MAYVRSQLGAGPIGFIKAHQKRSPSYKRIVYAKVPANMGGFFDNLLKSAKSAIATAEGAVTTAVIGTAQQETAAAASNLVQKAMHKKTKAGAAPVTAPMTSVSAVQTTAGTQAVVGAPVAGQTLPAAVTVVGFDIKKYAPYIVAGVGGLVLVVLIARKK